VGSRDTIARDEAALEQLIEFILYWHSFLEAVDYKVTHVFLKWTWYAPHNECMQAKSIKGSCKVAKVVVLALDGRLHSGQ
jgi:hypothetical protein